MQDLTNVDLASVLLTIAHKLDDLTGDEEDALVEAACRLNDLDTSTVKCPK